LVIDFLHRNGSVQPYELRQVLECFSERVAILFRLDRVEHVFLENPLGWILASGTNQQKPNNENDGSFLRPRSGAMLRAVGDSAMDESVHITFA
jgi:hypothetical protein